MINMPKLKMTIPNFRFVLDKAYFELDKPFL